MRILFWNTHRNTTINSYLLSLVEDYDIDILVIAEYQGCESELCKLLQRSKQKLKKNNTFGCERLNVWSNYYDIEPNVQGTYHYIQVIKKKLVLCCVHLFSDLHGDYRDDRLDEIEQIMNDINKIESKIESKKTIIIGDFNEMPYDKGCLSAKGFHGLPALRLDDKPTRTVRKKAYRKFYNPMWNLMGDFHYPPGTYFLNKAQLYAPMWYMLDQVIISKDIIPLFKKDSLNILTKCSYSDLMDLQGRPDKSISDHFPIICEIIDKGEL